MMDELYSGDQNKIKLIYVSLTKSDSRGFAGVDNIDAISDAALPVLYAKVKRAYESRLGRTFSLKE